MGLDTDAVLMRHMHVLHKDPITQVKVDGPVRPRNGPVSKRDRNVPVFRSLNISTFHGLKTRNGPIIFIIYTGLL